MNRKTYIILSLLAGIYLVNGICSINALSVTFDEGAHFSYGIRMLKGRPERVNPENDNSKMPISALNAIPRAVEQFFSKGLKRKDNGVHDIKNGRYVTLLFSLLTLLLVFTWSSSLYGVHAGLFSVFLFIFCPNNLAAAVLVTTDSYSVFFLTATMFFLWKYCNSKSIRDLLGFTLFLALSQLAKQSLLHLYVLAPVCMFVYALVLGEKPGVTRVLKNLLIIASVSWLIINAGFLFYDMNHALGDHHFRSGLFTSLQGMLPGNFPLPLSSAFIEGLDLAKYYDQLGGGLPESSMGNITILGHSATGKGIWYYYLVSIFFKTPISFLLLFAWGILLVFKNRTFKEFTRNEFFLLAPVLYFLVLFSFFYKSQGGIRHIIFIYPLFFILCGKIICRKNAVRYFPVLFIAGVFLLYSVGRYFNNDYAYTNEFIGDKKSACLYVGASNLNAGQGGYFIRDYLEGHPGVQLAPEKPQAGKFILTVDQYLDVWNTGKYAWLRKLKPADHLFHCYLLFEVKPGDIVEGLP